MVLQQRPGKQCCCFVCLYQDQLGVAEFCGKYHSELKPGCQYVGFDICGICVGSRVVSSRVCQNITDCTTKTKDNVFVKVSVAVQQQPRMERIQDCLYKLRNPGQQVDSYVTDVVRSEVPKMTLDEVFSEKDNIAKGVNESLTSHMDEYGWEILSSLVTHVDIKDLGVKQSMNQMEASKRNKVAAEVKAATAKNVMVKRAEGDAEAKALQGEGISRQRSAIVQGLKDSVGLVDPDEVSELLLMTQYFDTLETISSRKGNTIFIPHSVSGVADVSRQIQSGVLRGVRGIPGAN